MVGMSATPSGARGSAAMAVSRVRLVGLEALVTDYPDFVEELFEVGFDHDPAPFDAVGDVLAGYRVCDVGVGCDALEPRV